jgi:hypothetical protein
MKKQIFQRLLVALEMTQTKMTDDALGYIANKLEPYGEPALTAIEKAMETEKYKLTLASIMQHLPKHSVFPPAQQVWANIPSDESQGGWVFDEAMTALAESRYGDNQYSLNRFIESYERLTQQAEMEGRKPNWFYSPPTAADYQSKQIMYAQHTETARQLGWLNEQTYQRLLTRDGLQETSTGLKPLPEALTSQRTETAEKATGYLGETAQKALAQLKQQTN